MGGGDSRPRESRSNEYEPREPDDQQGIMAGSTSEERDTIQQEISAYTREGNPSESGEEPVPEFQAASEVQERSDDPIAPVDAMEEATGESDGEDGERGSEDRIGELGNPDESESEEAEDDDEATAVEPDREPSQERVSRMAVMTAMWGGTRVVGTAGEEVAERTERMADEVAERAEVVTADSNGQAE